MERELAYGRDRFGRALGLLEERDLSALDGTPNTARNRLRGAVLQVYPCVSHHFPSDNAYRGFTELMEELRDRDPAGRILAAIDGMPPAVCDDFVQRLAAIARVVANTRLPSERERSGRPLPEVDRDAWVALVRDLPSVVLDPLTYRETEDRPLPAGSLVETPELSMRVAEHHNLPQVTVRARCPDGQATIARVEVSALRAALRHADAASAG